MKILFPILVLSFCFFSCNTAGQEPDSQLKTKLAPTNGHPGIELTLSWETASLLSTVESVIYDSKNNFIYTANINGHFMDKDGNGFISKLNLAGEIVDLKWITGLDAPTGLGIYKDKLYTTDIDRIIEIDISQGVISNIYAVNGAKAFNDVVISKEGTVYCSDTGGNQIFALKDGQIILIKDNIDTPNGLLSVEEKLLVTQWTPKTVSFMDLATKNLTSFADGITGTDGLAAFGDGTYLASGFNGLIYHLAQDGSKQLLLDTSKDQIKAADIEYIVSEKLLLVPTMDSNKIMAYTISLSQQNNANKALYESIETTVENAMEQHNIPAISLGLVQNGKLTYYKGFGVQQRGKSEKVNEKSIYQIGSLSKMFTGIIAKKLMLKDQLDTTASIITYLPKKFSNQAISILGKVTIKDLLHHRSGFPRSPPGDRRAHGDAPMLIEYSEQDMLKALNEVQVAFEPGTRFSYSNFGYGVLGYICERVSGKTYSNLIDQYITEKYNLKNTFIYPSPQQSHLIAVPYNPHNRNEPTVPWKMGKASPSGGVYSNILDLSKLMEIQIEAYQEFSKESALVLHDNSNPAMESDHYGLGLVKSVRPHGIFYNHSGDMDGFASSYLFNVEDGLGLILLTTSGGAWFQDLQDQLLAVLLGL